jgi:oligopeptide transport system substrate-binding protein
VKSSLQIRAFAKQLTTILLIGVSCSCSSESIVDRATKNKVLILGNGGEPKALDPHLVSAVGDSNIMYSLFEGLVTYDPSQDTAAAPGVATHWEPNDDFTVWTFFLRENAKWSNGDPVTANDFAYSYQRILTPDLASPYSSMLYGLKNAELFNKSERTRLLFNKEPVLSLAWNDLKGADYGPNAAAQSEFNKKGLDALTASELEALENDPSLFSWPDEIPTEARVELVSRSLEFTKTGKSIWELANVGVKVLDDYTLELSLTGPTAFFPEVVKHTTYLPVHQPTIEKFGSMVDQFTLWQRPGNHVGNGTYKLKSWRINHSVVVEKNPHYWDAETAKIEEIRFLPIVSIFTEERMFRDGQMHASYTMPRNLIEWYKASHPEMIRIDGYYASYFYDFNLERPPFDNPKVRLALNLAIDRQKIVDNITLAGERPSKGFTPPTRGGYQPPDMIKFDPARAKALLAEAGFPNGEGFPDVSIKFNTLESHKAIAVAIQDMWKTNLNLNQVELQNEEWKVFQQTRQDHNFDISRDGWTGDFIDPTTFLNLFRSGDSHNHSRYSNPKYDELLEKAANIQDPQERLDVLKQAETVMLTDLPIIPIYTYAKPFLIHPDLKGWDPLLLDNHPYKHLDVVPSGTPFRF